MNNAIKIKENEEVTLTFVNNVGSVSAKWQEISCVGATIVSIVGNDWGSSECAVTINNAVGEVSLTVLVINDD